MLEEVRQQTIMTNFFPSFHRDRVLYTHPFLSELYDMALCNPGPTNIDNAITLCNLADRSDADVRGVKMGASASSSAFVSISYYHNKRALLDSRGIIILWVAFSLFST